MPEKLRSQRYDQAYLIVQQQLTTQGAWHTPRAVLRGEAKLQDLISAVTPRVYGAPSIRVLTVLLCAIGPQGVGPPPPEVYGELLGLLRRLQPRQRVARCLEVVVAYGTGGWPVLREPPYATPWHDAWPQAYSPLTGGLIKDEIEGWVKRSWTWLRHRVIDFDEAIHGVGWDAVTQPGMLAWDLSSMLVQGRCDCYRLRDAEKPPPALHLRQHQLLAWGPELVSPRGAIITLWDFIAQAVKGALIQRQQFAAGAFVAGMLYPLFAREIGLTLGHVARRHCPNRASHANACYYEVHLAACPRCQHPFDHRQDVIVSQRLLIIPGRYLPQPWWHCHPCRQSPRSENYFRCEQCRPSRPGETGGNEHGTPEDTCPLCNAPHGLRASQLYER
jgi:hypothetical protein